MVSRGTQDLRKRYESFKDYLSDRIRTVSCYSFEQQLIEHSMFVCSDNCTVGMATEYLLATVAYLRFVHVRHEHTVRIRHVRRYQIISTCTFDCS